MKIAAMPRQAMDAPVPGHRDSAPSGARKLRRCDEKPLRKGPD